GWTSADPCFAVGTGEGDGDAGRIDRDQPDVRRDIVERQAAAINNDGKPGRDIGRPCGRAERRVDFVGKLRHVDALGGIEARQRRCRSWVAGSCKGQSPGELVEAEPVEPGRNRIPPRDPEAAPARLAEPVEDGPGRVRVRLLQLNKGRFVADVGAEYRVELLI